MRGAGASRPRGSSFQIGSLKKGLVANINTCSICIV
ncbi:hypothetical protein BIFADO_01521 [Bifidobacterium adolescentis L2-32]|uniref:Uncharacterized protein n=1 Tax=Bifidobacterium adolescentis L2-32 TaxID=411481 RepID=A7A6N8_BIFAD|nr:hypothetical protein BIFADO_01521 [Bifidobacterium adolescentis L2-32]